MKFATAILSTLVLAAPALAQESQSIDMAEVPAPVIEAAQGAVSGVTFDTANLDRDGGTDTFELSGIDADGMRFEVDATANGTIEEVEEQVSVEDLPAEVKTAMEVNLSGIEPTMIEKSTREGGQVIVYEFEAERDGQFVNAEVGEDGADWKVVEDADS